MSKATKSGLGKSYRRGCPVKPASLRMLKMTYYGFDGEYHRGTLVVAKSTVGDYKKVFAAALAAKFPINKMKPTSSYGGSDLKAMADDNTSAFNCRHVTGNPYRVSQHSYGNAIDINTRENPYVTSSRVYPASGLPFLVRDRRVPGLIMPNSPIATTMRSLGWHWGARWSNPDYQHFSQNGG